MTSLTMPSACHFVIRSNFMLPEQIGLIPNFGYKSEASSFKAIIWLKYIASTKKIKIHHSRNGLEKTNFDFKVDGYDAENKTVYIFHGCVFHGCPKCFDSCSSNVLKTYSKHQLRIKKLKTSNEGMKACGNAISKI